MISMSSILMSRILFVTVFSFFVLQFQSLSISVSFGCGSFLLVLFLRSCNVLFVSGAFVCVSVFLFLLVKIFRSFFGFLVPDSFFFFPRL